MKVSAACPVGDGPNLREPCQRGGQRCWSFSVMFFNSTLGMKQWLVVEQLHETVVGGESLTEQSQHSRTWAKEGWPRCPSGRGRRRRAGG